MVNLELEYRLARQRIDDLHRQASRRREALAARTPRAAEPPPAEVVQIPHAKDLRQERA